MTGTGAVVYVVVVLWLTGYAAMQLRRARGSRSWPSTTGEIVRSGSHSSPLGESTKARPRIEYAYRIDGLNLLGSRISFHELISPERTRDLLARYPLGSPVEVYYDPTAPTLSVLEPGPRWINYALVIFFVALNAGLLVYALGKGKL